MEFFVLYEFIVAPIPIMKKLAALMLSIPLNSPADDYQENVIVQND